MYDSTSLGGNTGSLELEEKIQCHNDSALNSLLRAGNIKIVSPIVQEWFCCVFKAKIRPNYVMY